MSWRALLFAPAAPGWSILVRLLVGLVVFLPEGIQQLAFPEILGRGTRLAVLYLLLVGAGAWSLDAALAGGTARRSGS